METILGDSIVLMLVNNMVNSFYFARYPLQVHLYPYVVAHASFFISVAIKIVATNGGDGGAPRPMGHSHPIFPPIEGFFYSKSMS